LGNGEPILIFLCSKVASSRFLLRVEETFLKKRLFQTTLQEILNIRNLITKSDFWQPTY